MPLRLAVSADLHFDVARSHNPAKALAAEADSTDADALLLVGDTATADEDALEACLSLFRSDRPRLFVPGNHELWSRRRPRDAEKLLALELPARVRAAGWHWLPGDPFRAGEAAVVGSLGWYDYRFAEPRLGVPERFYADKLTPSAAAAGGRHDLFPDAADVPDHARGFVARWNDGRFIAGINGDRAFLARRLAELEVDLARVHDARAVLAAVHVAPLAELLPRVPPHGPVPAEKRKLAFARAYLGSPAIGDLLLRHGNVTHVVCGHTHAAREETVSGRRCVNIGSTYTEKRLMTMQVG